MNIVALLTIKTSIKKPKYSLSFKIVLEYKFFKIVMFPFYKIIFQITLLQEIIISKTKNEAVFRFCCLSHCFCNSVCNR